MGTRRYKGILVAFEGVDGSGKRTQASLLATAVERLGLEVKLLSFPNYKQSFFGGAVSDYLQGRFGQLSEVPAEFAALLFAGDRWEAQREIVNALKRGSLVICDRYVASNLAYQGARVDEANRPRLMRWIEDLEYNVFDLPKPDVTVYLDLPVHLALAKLSKRPAKNHRTFVQDPKDLHETDVSLLERCRGVYTDLGKTPAFGDWITIDCATRDGNWRGIEALKNTVWDKLQNVVDFRAELASDSNWASQNHRERDLVLFPDN